VFEWIILNLLEFNIDLSIDGTDSPYSCRKFLLYSCMKNGNENFHSEMPRLERPILRLSSRLWASRWGLLLYRYNVQYYCMYSNTCIVNSSSAASQAGSILSRAETTPISRLIREKTQRLEVVRAVRCISQ